MSLSNIKSAWGANYKQGRIHGSPVMDGWAGAVMRKPLGIQKCDGPTDRLTRQDVVACPEVKRRALSFPLNRIQTQKWDDLASETRDETTVDCNFSAQSALKNAMPWATFHSTLFYAVLAW